MQADYIKTIIGKINELPYKSILFDGKWGIGKSYAVNEALETNDNVCRISMFGLNNANQIYHEVLFQLALKNSLGGKIGEITNNFLDGLSAVWEKAGQAKDVISNIARERELFLLLSKSFKSFHIVVIDDLERCSDKINLEEVFGIVEELKQCPCVKVILIAHTEKIKGSNKEIFDKYNEKVIDRIYHITEIAKDINWGKLKIHAGFITEFLELHKVKNLRTLEKAQHFFDDVILFCNNITHERFINEIRLICFAIVVESTDGLYYKESNANEKNAFNQGLLEIHNELEYRIGNYLRGVMISRNMVSLLLQYYENKSIINEEFFNTEYKLFLEAGNKANYYRTDEEIKIVLPNLRNKMNEVDNISELNRFADEYMVWSDILEEDNTLVLQEYRNRLQELLRTAISGGKEKFLDYGADVLFHMSSEKIKDAYSEEVIKMRKEMIEIYIRHLQQTATEAYDYSYRLRKTFESSYYRDIIIGFSESLYDIKFFPVGEIDEMRYHTCYNIMYILCRADKDKFLRYCDKLRPKCDHMSYHRIKVLADELINENN